MKTGIHQTLSLRALCALLAAALAVPALTPAHAIAAEETTFTFNGGGWGHGIGLSQYGAKGYAEKGWAYDRILKHYYQGTRLETKPAVTVRVNLDKAKAARNRWRVQASKDTTITFIQLSDTTKRVALRQLKGSTPAIWWVTTAGNDTRVHADDGGRPGEVVEAFAGRCYVTSDAPIRIVDRSGPFNHTNVAWRGRLHFIPQEATTSICVNYVDMEDYLKGVVPRESPSSFPTEALKAQAVAARSYAYQDAVEKRVLWCTAMSQVYNGQSRPEVVHEPASTNAAVAATAGQLVWYGTETKPVKTYFSSSSGGHTANVEDVWFSTPRPYYKGVVDEDKSGNPYYSWTTGALTASDVSNKVRARVGSSYAAPAPHLITNVALERASTGHVRYANITWSNGVTYKIRGDTMRGALGLRSTKFTVATKRPEPVTNVYSEANANLAWSGPWKRITRGDAHGGTYARAGVARSRFVARFDGTSVRWVGTKGPSFGRSSVAINGVEVATVDLYAASTRTKQTLFTTSGLSQGEHTLTVTALSSKNARSSGVGTSLDRIYVTGGTLLSAPVPVQRYQESGARVVEFGGWSSETTAVASGGSRIFNASVGARAVVDFYGEKIAWVGSKGPGLGSASVRLDDGPSRTISLDASATAHQATLFESGTLDRAKPHRLTIEVRPGSSGSGRVFVDRLDVTGGWVKSPLLPSTRVQETRVKRSGSWTTYRNALASGGTHIVSGRRGSAVNVVFEGSGIAWYGAKTRHYGKAEVLLDGVRIAVVDLYNPTVVLNRKIWGTAGLPAKRHVLTIRVLGTKRTAAIGTLVSVDAFVIKGQPVVE